MSHKFSQDLKRRATKTHNGPAAVAAWVTLRRRVLEEIGVDSARVFDAFAGAGSMYRAVWQDARVYIGCDLEWYRDERSVFVADNRRVLRAIDLTAFNVFDLDTFGSPWEQVLIIARRRPLAPGETIGLVLTEGSALKLKMGQAPTALRIIAGISASPAALARRADELLDRALAGLCRRMGADMTRQWRAVGNTGAQVRYAAVVLKGKAIPAASAA